MFITVRIRQHERGLWFRHGDFHRLLGPGRYRFWSRLWSRTRDTVEIVDTLKTRFEHRLLDVLIADAQLRDALKLVELTDAERALVWRDGRLLHILGPGRYAFWRTPYTVEDERFSLAEGELRHARLEAIVKHPDAKALLETVDAHALTTVLLFRDGRLVGPLAEGRHAFWTGAGQITCRAIDRREQLADVAGQDIMTADKVTLRVNLLVGYVVSDAVRAATGVADYAQALYREAQLALRATVGGRTLDALLADKNAVGGEVRDAIARRAAEFGVAVRSVGLRDVILPGDMKEILNQVIAAEKQAQANLIKRREETAAARSQANTAKLLAENPTLARLKELELLQEILAGAKTTFVFGPQELGGQLRKLVATDSGDT